MDELETNFYEDNSETKEKDVKPLIAGILLIIAAIISIMFFSPALLIDVSLLENIGVDISPIQEAYPSFTIEDFKNLISICASIVIVLSIFTLLAGILSIKRKLWGIALAGSIIGLFTIFGSIPSLIAMILLIFSRKEFK